MTAMGDDGLGHAARSDEMDFARQGGENFFDESVDHGGGTVEDATLHTFEGITTNHVLGFLDGDGRQLRGALTQCAQRGFDSFYLRGH